MAIETRDACGFNNGLAKITYSFDNSFSPPEVTEIRLVNNGPSATFNVSIFAHDSTRTFVRSFSHAAGQGADQVLDRAGVVAIFGDMRMLDVVGHDLSHGWDFPFFYQCWSS